VIHSLSRRTNPKHNIALLTAASALFAPSISHAAPAKAAPAKAAPAKAAPAKAAPASGFAVSPDLDLEPKYPKSGERGADVPEFVVRPGYRVSLVARDLDEARFLEIDDKGTLYVSQPGRGSIVTLRLKNGVYEKLGTFISDKKSVHGMCFSKGWMWFTQSGAIYKARDTNGDGTADETVTVIPQGQLPEGGGHWWRSIAVSDNFLYTSIGDDGNINDHTGDDREKVWRFNLDGTGKTLWSSGIRNTEKLRLRPGTQEVWGADHGSDNFGAPLEKEGQKGQAQAITDFNPPCEFNFYEEGKFYGHPFITGNRVPRIEFQARPDILELAAKTTPPAWSFGAHWAPNGWTFLSRNLFPEGRGDAFVALHGSWNSSQRVGYRIERVMFDPMTGKPFGAQMIVGLMTPGGEVLDRPVDCVEAPDGSILFSCDSRRIFRITPASDKTKYIRRGANVGF
jgi:glucose/arabinose dehydrogenase